MNVIPISAGRYRVEANGLVFEINKVERGGWYITGIGDASDTLVKISRIEGTYGSLKGAKRRIEDMLDTPEAKLFQRALALPVGEPGEFDIAEFNPEHVREIALALNYMSFSTYINSGKLGAQR